MTDSQLPNIGLQVMNSNPTYQNQQQMFGPQYMQPQQYA